VPWYVVSLHGHKTIYFLRHRRFTSAWHLDWLWAPPYLLSVVSGRRVLSTYANIALVFYTTFYSQAREILSTLHAFTEPEGNEGIQIPVIVV
jgi:hypothetical protein